MKLRHVVTLAMIGLVSACGDRGVENPEGFFAKNRPYLAQAVEDLKKSGILRIQTLDYASADKLFTSKDDERLHEKLQSFIKDNNVISISVIRSRSREGIIFQGVSFHLAEKKEAFSTPIEISLAYVMESVRPEWFYRDASCKSLLSPSWFACTWSPA